MSQAALIRTQQNQREASDPARSAWVVANAGSGKTHVLTQRVVRLLLDGADPGSILCLTFTKTAAAEMSRRIFGRLAEWATMPEPALRSAILATTGEAATTTDLRDARRLFARALETPGGLKIQTIHGFCERLLHQFPFEANVPGHFGILDDSAADAMLAEAQASVLLRAQDGEPRLAQAVRFLAESCTDSGISRALDAVIARRENLRRWMAEAAGDHGAGTIDDALEDLRARLGLTPDEDAETVCREICGSAHWPLADCRALADKLVAALSHKYDVQARAGLAAIHESAHPGLEAEARLEFFLNSGTDGSAKARSMSGRFSPEFRKQEAGLEALFEAEATRLLALAEKFVAARTLKATEALLVVGDAILQAYGDAKKRSGLLDFGDLIARTRHLLSRADATDWILYKLDIRLRHILVDEAQDTSPDQWEIVRALAADFFSGAGAVAARRTVFAVGDDKQSIFGFQGAAPGMLAEMEQHFQRAVHDADLPFARRPLFLSFRSTTEVLDAVDAVFGRPDAPPITASDYEIHAAHRLEHPGRVVVLPRVERAKGAEPESWTEPLDAPTAAEILLADDLARRIRELVGSLLPSGKRLKAGEVLVLVRKRDAFVAAINRALRREGVPAAGADRIAVASHIAVMDLLALADAVLLPEDDLQLAALLKSPLFDWSEDQLMALAVGRGKAGLWQALHRSDDEASRAAAARLRAWRAMADQVTPFRFFATILGPDGGRRAFRSRLGGETEDVLDTFIGQALAYERTEAPSLQGFVAFVRASRSDIKREAEGGASGVRVMTVHGAKGLEADVVFLVDTGSAIVHSSHRDLLVRIEDARRGPAFLWRRGKSEATAAQRTADQRADAEAEREYFRLLYVAMTRARDILYVAGIKGDRTPPNCWYKTVAAALVPADAERTANGELAAESVWPAVQRPPRAAEPESGAAAEALDTPPWLHRPAPSPAAAPEPLRPSRALAEPDPLPTAPAFPSAGGASARRRGNLVHKLLQWLPALPPEEREPAAARFLTRNLPDEPELAAEVRGETEAVLRLPALQRFFGPDSRAEVAMVGTVPTGRGDFAVSGQIDRLVADAAGWSILDFKTNRAVPDTVADVDAAYVLQLALYRRLLAGISPARPVSAFLVYSAGPKIIPVPAAEMDAALARLGVVGSGVS